MIYVAYNRADLAPFLSNELWIWSGPGAWCRRLSRRICSQYRQQRRSPDRRPLHSNWSGCDLVRLGEVRSRASSGINFMQAPGRRVKAIKRGNNRRITPRKRKFVWRECTVFVWWLPLGKHYLMCLALSLQNRLSHDRPHPLWVGSRLSASDGTRQQQSYNRTRGIAWLWKYNHHQLYTGYKLEKRWGLKESSS